MTYPTTRIGPPLPPESPRRRKRGRRALAISLAVLLVIALAAGGFVLTRMGSKPSAQAAQGPSPSSAPSGRQITLFQSNLNVLEQNINSPDRGLQALALVPTLHLSDGSSMTHAGLSGVKFDRSTFRQSGHFGLIQATAAQGQVYTVGLYHDDKSGWLIYGTRPGPLAKTAAALTRQPSRASPATLVAYQHPADSSGCLPGVGTRLPVILVHGFLSAPSVWGSLSNSSSMLATLSRMPGVDVTTFDYSGANKSWVDNTAIGPALARTIKCDANASAQAGGPGKVVIIAHSMGGDATRWAATNGGAGDLIGKVVEIGTPNLGSALANVADPVVQAVCQSASSASLYGAHANVCPDISALQGLSLFSSQIGSLPWVPSSIPVTSIAGDLSIGTMVFAAHVVDNTLSDLVVGENSALQTRDSSSGSSLVVSCTVTPIHLDASCWHEGLPNNQQVVSITAKAIRDYLATLPAPAPSPSPSITPTPSPSPTITGAPPSPDQAWLADDGVWRVHDTKLQLEQSGSGLSGTMFWNAGPCDLFGHPGVMCTGLADMTVTVQPDGSLKLVFGNVRYVSGRDNPDTYGYQPDPSMPQNGQDFSLVQLQQYLAKAVPDGGNSPGYMQPGQGNRYMCQNDLGQPLRMLKCGLL